MVHVSFSNHRPEGRIWFYFRCDDWSWFLGQETLNCYGLKYGRSDRCLSDVLLINCGGWYIVVIQMTCMWYSFDSGHGDAAVFVSGFVTRGQFWPSGIVVACVCLSVCVSVCVCVRQPRACPGHKSPRVQARTTKFGQKVQNNLVKVPIVFGCDWPWPSRSNLTWKAKFTPFWACPRHNSSSIQARTTKFGQKMQTNLLVVLIVLGGDWLRPSWSNLTR